MKSLIVTLAALLCTSLCFGQSAETIDKSHLMQPEDLVKVLQSNADKPLILSVGFKTLYAQHHIPGAEYVGAAGEKDGLEQLRKRVQPLPKKTSIVIYCGCCPWSHCPNLGAAYKALADMGFTNVQALYIANNFGQDWVQKGYPTEKGH